MTNQSFEMFALLMYENVSGGIEVDVSRGWHQQRNSYLAGL